jgi:SAM-dependent methyltransferase
VQNTPLPAVFRNVTQSPDGVWRVAARSAVSYPEQGHDTCHAVEDHSFWFAHRNRCIAAVLRRFPADQALPFADVGGGNGFVAAMIGSLGYRVVLIEPGPGGIAHGRERGLGDLVQASIVDLDVAPGSLGAIGLFDVLEHIEDDAAALRSMHGMLADGGKIYATVPAHQWLWSNADDRAGHFRRYTRTQLAQRFARNGFDVDLCSYYFWPLPLPMWLMRSIPDRLSRSKADRSASSRVEAEHRPAGRLLQSLLAPEVRALARGRSLPVGASCIVVATRRADAGH